MIVSYNEILFIKENAPKGFPAMIKEYLKARGIEKNRTNIHTEISTLKESYNEDIIKAARELLKTVKKVQYN